MKLWQAMLKGAQNTYQAFGTWSDGDGGTCAMGAVMAGMGLITTTHEWYGSYQQMMETYPELRGASACPEGCCTGSLLLQDVSLANVIMHLNDKHHWSRQRIAEWLSGSKVSEAPKIEKEAVAS